jgi:hypothetical protein
MESCNLMTVNLASEKMQELHSDSDFEDQILGIAAKRVRYWLLASES